MSADAYFRMGSTHAICQDYAVAGSRDGAPFAFLSDGCSGTANKNDPGSPHTDFGARFLVRAALRELPEMLEGRFHYRSIASMALATANMAGLGRTALDATLLAVVLAADSHNAHVFQTGDGVIAARRRDGGIDYFAMSFGENAPYYLSYLHDESLRQTFIRLAKTATETANSFKPGEGWGVATERTFDLHTYGICNARWFSVEAYDVVLIMSDGAESFFDHAGEGVPLESVLEQLFALKNLNGEFLTRRCNAFLHRFCTERGWKHADDFSVAGIYLGEAP